MTNSNATANPAPLGLLGFGMTTILLNLHNAGFIPLTSMVLGMGFFVGGLAQVVAGVLEWKKNNTFGMVAFTLYGFFWLSFVALKILPAEGMAAASTPFDAGFYLLVWGVFTAFMFIGTLRMTRAHQFIFASLTLLFLLLAIGDFTGNRLITIAAGYEGIICGISAFYTAMAIILNEIFDKTVLPLGAARPQSAPISAA